MPTFRKSVYKEHMRGGSPFYDLAVDRSMVRRTLRIIGGTGAVQQAARDFLGYAQVLGSGISRTIPMPFVGINDQNGVPTLFATQYTGIRGHGIDRTPANLKNGNPVTIDQNGVAAYKWSIGELHYETAPWDIVPDLGGGDPGFADDPLIKGAFPAGGAGTDESTLQRFVQKTYAPAGQMVTCPKGSMLFVARTTGAKGLGGMECSALNVHPPKLIPLWNIQIVHKFLPFNAVPCKIFNSNSKGAIDQALGCINDADFPEDGPFSSAFPKGCLLYCACTITPHSSAWWGRTYDVAHHFQFISNTAGLDFDPVKGGFATVIEDAGHNFVPHQTAGNGANPTAPDYIAPQFGWVKLSSDGNYYPDDASGKHIYDPFSYPKLFQPG